MSEYKKMTKLSHSGLIRRHEKRGGGQEELVISSLRTYF